MAVAPPRRVLVQLWPQSYTIAKLSAVPAMPATDLGSSPVAVIVGAGEVTLIAPTETVEEQRELIVSASKAWRLLTLSTVFPLDTIGVLHAVSDAFADVGIPIMVLSSHDTDHFLVPEALVGRALAALNHVRLERFLPK
jgi:hypothetical protein